MSEQRSSVRRREMGPSIEHTDLNKPTRFVSDMRFRVDVPKIECPLKALALPYDGQKLARFELTQEEKVPKWELLLPRFMGCRFDPQSVEDYSYEPAPGSPDQAELSDPETLDSMPSLDNEDYEILDAVESCVPEMLEINPDNLQVQSKKKKKSVSHTKDKESRWWIKEAAKGITQRQFDKFRKRNHKKIKKRKYRTFLSQESFNDYIKKGFDKTPPQERVIQIKQPAWGNPTSQQTTKTKKAVALYDLVSHEDELGREFCTVNFHNNCIEDSERLIPHGQHSTQISENVLLKELYVEPKDRQEADVNRAIGFDNKYLGLIVPCKIQNSADRRDSYIKTEANYLWIREYFYRKKEEESDLGKWKWAMRIDREKKVAQLVPIRKRFVTQKQKLRSEVCRPVSVKVRNTTQNEEINQD